MYFPLHVHSHFSVLDGLSKPGQIADRIKELGLPGCAITDHGNIGASVQFLKAMKKAGKKPILGCELYISQQDAAIKDKNNKTTHLVVLAKNNQGWLNLVKLVSESNKPELLYRKPRLDLDRLSKYCDGSLIGFSGHMGSELGNCLFTDYKVSFNSNLKIEDIRSSLKPNWKQEASQVATKLQNIFGKGNFYVEIQLMDCKVSPAQIVIAECLREIAKDLGIPTIATPDAHYPRKEDCHDQRVLLCSSLQTTLAIVQHKIEDDEFGLSTFFKSDCYHIPSYEELKEVHTEEELKNTLLLAEQVEEYNVLRQPILPQFECPDGLNADEYLRQLVREGWVKKKAKGKIPKESEQIYVDRVKYELEVLQGAGLSAYFLIVADIMNFVRKNGWIPGPGRGSAAGCLVSYLTGITSIDPIKYDLMFERFYNAGRNTKDRVSMPDIDMDIPADKRAEVIEYIKNKYGVDRVSQMITYQTMKGRGALKEVLRSYGGISFDVMNQITQHIPDEAKIADDLQVMKEETGESSIIRWALENRADKLKEWCYIDEDGSLSGPLAKRFEQAIRLEGTKKSPSKHAAGLIISPYPLHDMCPMVYDSKTGNQIAGLEMGDLEDIGMIKFDCLGVSVLDKLMSIQEIAATGEMNESELDRSEA
jgi:DNA polymerase-3 subunit alpha